MSRYERDFGRRFAGWTAAPMFSLAVAFLVGQAVLVVLWVDVPNLQEAAARRLEVAPAAPTAVPTAATVERAVVRVLLVLWPLFWIEAAGHWLTRPWNRSTRRFHFASLLFCFCPSLRLCPRNWEMGGRVWLPRFGWCRPDRRLRRHLERHFSLPMILIALLILPVLVVEFFLKNQVAEYGWLRQLLHLGTGLIWFAFAAEFILMISVAERKLVYVKEHWVDLAIILLPLLSFLRSLQVMRASRLMRIGKLPQVTKLVRVYRLRGTAVRAFRALVFLDILDRLFQRDRAARVAHLKRQVWDLERESRRLRWQIRRLEREIAAAESSGGRDGKKAVDGVTAEGTAAQPIASSPPRG